MEKLLNSGEIIFVDTAPFIFLFENHKTYSPVVAEFFDKAADKNCRIHTSFITYMEICVQPLRLGREDIADSYARYFCQNQSLAFHSSLNMNVVQNALQLQLRYALRVPDSLQVALAIEHKASMILTNDKKWKQIKEVAVLLVEELPHKTGFN